MSQQLRRLYQVAKELNQIKWHQFWYEDEPVIVRTSQSGELACCVFVDFGVNIYLGDEGMTSYFNFLNIENESESEHDLFKAFYRQNMISIAFEDRIDLDEVAYEQIKSLGLTFRGKKQWPVFQRHQPGVVPDLLEDQAEIKLVTIILEQLKVILQQFKEESLVFEDKRFVLFQYQNGLWELDYIDLDIIQKKIVSPYAFNYSNDLKVHRLRKLPKINNTIEGIQFFLPEVYLDEETDKLVFPLITAFIERETGYAHLNDFSKHLFADLEQLSDKLADIILNDLKYRPSTIVVEDHILLDIIKDFCRQIDITCEVGTTSEAITFMETMFKLTGEKFNNNELSDLAMSDEFMLPELLETLLEDVYEIYLAIAEMPQLNKIPEVQKQALLEIFSYLIVHMAVEYGETLPNWTKKSFEGVLKSHVIEREISARYKRYVNVSIIRLLECIGELKYLNNCNQLINIAQKHYG